MTSPEVWMHVREPCRGLENTYVLRRNACVIKIFKLMLKSIYFWYEPGYQRKIKDHCAIHSQMFDSLITLTLQPVKDEVTLTARYAKR